MKYSVPTLSIITLTRNRSALLRKNLESLEHQIGKKDEIIIVDNGSTDETSAVLSAFHTRVPVRVFHMKHGKYPHLYNKGIKHAKKEIIVFLDDDCIADASFLKRIRIAHRKRPRAAIQGMTYSIPKHNIYADIMGDHYQSFITTNLLDPAHMRILDNKNASIGRKLIHDLDGFCEQLDCGSEDIEFGIRMRSQGIPILFDPSIIAYHRERTSFEEFVTQHMRFARCERHLDRIVPKNERIGLVRIPKLMLQIRSALKREYTYIKTGKYWDALRLPFLYGVLGMIRIIGYIRGI